MEKKQIMVVCTHNAILQTIIRLIDQDKQWHGIAAENVNQALQIYAIRPIDLILLGAGLHEEEENRLKKLFSQTPCVKHYGGGSGLLSAEIHQALDHVG